MANRKTAMDFATRYRATVAGFVLCSLAIGGLQVLTPQASATTWPSDWADSSFCSAEGVPYMETTFEGVAACGDPYTNENSNMQGPVTYDGVSLDTVGFQCVELAARYFYYATGGAPPGGNANTFVSLIASDYGYGVYPTSGGTDSLTSTLQPGQIVSMWSAANPTGHVGVVTKVSVTNGSGTVTMMDENASAGGSDQISVANGQLSAFSGSLLDDEFQWDDPFADSD